LIALGRNAADGGEFVPRAQLLPPGELERRAAEAAELLKRCAVCPRACAVDRTSGHVGTCGIGAAARVASYGPHHGEEAPLVGPDRMRGGGSGTVFFSGCNLLCSFCQNYDISHSPVGPEVSAERLASIMIELQRRGCHNVNFVTPTHVVPQILSCLPIAIDRGFTLPLVYNSSGYDSVQTLRLLEGVIDIYMPDFKFWHGEGAAWLSDADDYADVATAAVQEMHRQVGDLIITDGVAVSGMIVRHLVMPRNAANSRAIFSFLASISVDTYVNVMDQYRPCYQAGTDPIIGTLLRRDEYLEAVRWAREAGLRRLA
jgi:putative pyruvate formate lyase activating enzyme